MSDRIQSHPAYADGYWAAMEGEPIWTDECTPEYRAGWEAAWRAKEILSGSGMTETAPGEFSTTISLTNGAA